jgi:hypothetical protein
MEEIRQKLLQLYTMLERVETHGDSTILMAQSLISLKSIYESYGQE